MSKPQDGWLERDGVDRGVSVRRVGGDAFPARQAAIQRGKLGVQVRIGSRKEAKYGNEVALVRFRF